MKNIFITAALLLTGATYAQVTINQESNIADAMEYKKEVARSESAFQVQIYNGNITEANKALLDAKNIPPCSLSNHLITKCASVASAHA